MCCGFTWRAKITVIHVVPEDVFHKLRIIWRDLKWRLISRVMENHTTRLTPSTGKRLACNIVSNFLTKSGGGVGGLQFSASKIRLGAKVLVLGR